MTRGTIRGWYLVHKWTSLICTAFLLLLCVTGLPLIFGEEIARLTGGEPEVTTPVRDTRPANLDTLIAKAVKQYPGNRPLFLGWWPDEPIVYVNLGPTADTPPAAMKTANFDAYTGAAIPVPQFNEGVMYFIYRLHTDVFLGLPAMLFLGAMALLFAVAIVSGLVIYGPFMRKLDFGTVRRGGSTRLKWLDLHNLLGAVTLAWALVVGITGLINTLAQPLERMAQRELIAKHAAAYAGKPTPTTFASLDAAVATARGAAPGTTVLRQLSRHRL